LTVPRVPQWPRDVAHQDRSTWLALTAYCAYCSASCSMGLPVPMRSMGY
jgi:hypothetical protein